MLSNTISCGLSSLFMVTFLPITLVSSITPLTVSSSKKSAGAIALSTGCCWSISQRWTPSCLPQIHKPNRNKYQEYIIVDLGEAHCEAGGWGSLHEACVAGLSRLRRLRLISTDVNVRAVRLLRNALTMQPVPVRLLSSIRDVVARSREAATKQSPVFKGTPCQEEIASTEEHRLAMTYVV